MHKAVETLIVVQKISAKGTCQFSLSNLAYFLEISVQRNVAVAFSEKQVLQEVCCAVHTLFRGTETAPTTSS